MTATRLRWRRLIGPAILEAVLLTLGVVLALAADEWRQGRENRQDAQAASQAIAEELRLNRAAVASSATYHRGIIDSLRRRPAASPAPALAVFSRGFVSPAPVSSAAWQTASETGALEHLPHDLVLRLSRAYGLQGRYERQGEIVGGLIYGELYRGGADGIVGNYRNLGHLVSAFLYREDQLIALYESTLATLPARPERP